MSLFCFNVSKGNLIKIHYPCVGCGEFTTYQYKNETFCASLDCITVNNQSEERGMTGSWKEAIDAKYFGAVREHYDITNLDHVLDILCMKQIFSVGHYFSNPFSLFTQRLKHTPVEDGVPGLSLDGGRFAY